MASEAAPGHRGSGMPCLSHEIGQVSSMSTWRALKVVACSCFSPGKLEEDKLNIIIRL